MTTLGRCSDCDCRILYDEDTMEKKWFESSGMCMDCVSKTLERDYAEIEAEKRKEIAHEVYTDMMDTIYKITNVSPDQQRRWRESR